MGNSNSNSGTPPGVPSVPPAQRPQPQATHSAGGLSEGTLIMITVAFFILAAMVIVLGLMIVYYIRRKQKSDGDIINIYINEPMPSLLKKSERKQIKPVPIEDNASVHSYENLTHLSTENEKSGNERKSRKDKSRESVKDRSNMSLCDEENAQILDDSLKTIQSSHVSEPNEQSNYDRKSLDSKKTQVHRSGTQNPSQTCPTNVRDSFVKHSQANKTALNQVDRSPSSIEIVYEIPNNGNEAIDKLVKGSGLTKSNLDIISESRKTVDMVSSTSLLSKVDADEVSHTSISEINETKKSQTQLSKSGTQQGVELNKNEVNYTNKPFLRNIVKLESIESDGRESRSTGLISGKIMRTSQTNVSDTGSKSQSIKSARDSTSKSLPTEDSKLLSKGQSSQSIVNVVEKDGNLNNEPTGTQDSSAGKHTITESATISIAENADSSKNESKTIQIDEIKCVEVKAESEPATISQSSSTQRLANTAHRLEKVDDDNTALYLNSSSAESMESNIRKSGKSVSESMKDSKSINNQQLEEDDKKTEISIRQTISKSIGSVDTNAQKIDNDSQKIEATSVCSHTISSHRMGDEIKMDENIQYKSEIDKVISAASQEKVNDDSRKSDKLKDRIENDKTIEYLKSLAQQELENDAEAGDYISTSRSHSIQSDLNESRRSSNIVKSISRSSQSAKSNEQKDSKSESRKSDKKEKSSKTDSKLYFTRIVRLDSLSTKASTTSTQLTTHADTISQSNMTSVKSGSSVEIEENKLFSASEKDITNIEQSLSSNEPIIEIVPDKIRSITSVQIANVHVPDIIINPDEIKSLKSVSTQRSLDTNVVESSNKLTVDHQKNIPVLKISKCSDLLLSDNASYDTLLSTTTSKTTEISKSASFEDQTPTVPTDTFKVEYPVQGSSYSLENKIEVFNPCDAESRAESRVSMEYIDQIVELKSNKSRDSYKRYDKELSIYPSEAVINRNSNAINTTNSTENAEPVFAKISDTLVTVHSLSNFEAPFILENSLDVLYQKNNEKEIQKYKSKSLIDKVIELESNRGSIPQTDSRNRTSQLDTTATSFKKEFGSNDFTDSNKLDSTSHLESSSIKQHSKNLPNLFNPKMYYDNFTMKKITDESFSSISSQLSVSSETEFSLPTWDKDLLEVTTTKETIESDFLPTEHFPTYENIDLTIKAEITQIFETTNFSTDENKSSNETESPENKYTSLEKDESTIEREKTEMSEIQSKYNNYTEEHSRDSPETGTSTTNIVNHLVDNSESTQSIGVSSSATSELCIQKTEIISETEPTIKYKTIQTYSDTMVSTHDSNSARRSTDSISLPLSSIRNSDKLSSAAISASQSLTRNVNKMNYLHQIEKINKSDHSLSQSIKSNSSDSVTLSGSKCSTSVNNSQINLNVVMQNKHFQDLNGSISSIHSSPSKSDITETVSAPLSSSSIKQAISQNSIASQLLNKHVAVSGRVHDSRSEIKLEKNISNSQISPDLSASSVHISESINPSVQNVENCERTETVELSTSSSLSDMESLEYDSSKGLIKFRENKSFTEKNEDSDATETISAPLSMSSINKETSQTSIYSEHLNKDVIVLNESSEKTRTVDLSKSSSILSNMDNLEEFKEKKKFTESNNDSDKTETISASLSLTSIKETPVLSATSIKNFDSKVQNVVKEDSERTLTIEFSTPKSRSLSDLESVGPNDDLINAEKKETYTEKRNEKNDETETVSVALSASYASNASLGTAYSEKKFQFHPIHSKASASTQSVNLSSTDSYSESYDEDYMKYNKKKNVYDETGDMKSDATESISLQLSSADQSIANSVENHHDVYYIQNGNYVLPKNIEQSTNKLINDDNFVDEHEILRSSLNAFFKDASLLNAKAPSIGSSDKSSDKQLSTISSSQVSKLFSSSNNELSQQSQETCQIIKLDDESISIKSSSTLSNLSENKIQLNSIAEENEFVLAEESYQYTQEPIDFKLTDDVVAVASDSVSKTLNYEDNGDIQISPGISNNKDISVKTDTKTSTTDSSGLISAITSNGELIRSKSILDLKTTLMTDNSSLKTESARDDTEDSSLNYLLEWSQSAPKSNSKIDLVTKSDITQLPSDSDSILAWSTSGATINDSDTSGQASNFTNSRQTLDIKNKKPILSTSTVSGESCSNEESLDSLCWSEGPKPIKNFNDPNKVLYYSNIVDSKDATGEWNLQSQTFKTNSQLSVKSSNTPVYSSETSNLNNRVNQIYDSYEELTKHTEALSDSDSLSWSKTKSVSNFNGSHSDLAFQRESDKAESTVSDSLMQWSTRDQSIDELIANDIKCVLEINLKDSEIQDETSLSFSDSSSTLSSKKHVKDDISNLSWSDSSKESREESFKLLSWSDESKSGVLDDHHFESRTTIDDEHIKTESNKEDSISESLATWSTSAQSMQTVFNEKNTDVKDDPVKTSEKFTEISSINTNLNEESLTNNLLHPSDNEKGSYAVERKQSNILRYSNVLKSENSSKVSSNQVKSETYSKTTIDKMMKLKKLVSQTSVLSNRTKPSELQSCVKSPVPFDETNRCLSAPFHPTDDVDMDDSIETSKSEKLMHHGKPHTDPVLLMASGEKRVVELAKSFSVDTTKCDNLLDGSNQSISRIIEINKLNSDITIASKLSNLSSSTTSSAAPPPPPPLTELTRPKEVKNMTKVNEYLSRLRRGSLHLTQVLADGKEESKVIPRSEKTPDDLIRIKSGDFTSVNSRVEKFEQMIEQNKHQKQHTTSKKPQNVYVCIMQRNSDDYLITNIHREPHKT